MNDRNFEMERRHTVGHWASALMAVQGIGTVQCVKIKLAWAVGILRAWHFSSLVRSRE